MLAVIKHQTSKQQLVEWSSARNEKQKDAHSIWTLFFNDVVGDTQSDVEADANTGVSAVDHVEPATDERDKVIMVLDAMHPITAMETGYRGTWTC